METKLTPPLTCFQWQCHTSDLIDGLLPTATKKAHTAHLASCPRCSERYQHYRTLISTLTSLPKTPLPPELKTNSKLPSVPRMESMLIPLGQWDRLPWYVRTFLEGFGIVCLVLIGISIAPRIRSFYESNIQHHLNDYEDRLTTNPVANTEVPPLQVANAVHTAGTEEEDSIAGEADGESTEDTHSAHAARYEQSQLWRFTLKTVSPDELRPLVIQALTLLKVPSTTPGMGGVQVPGGIEFDLLLPAEIIPDLKTALEKLVSKPTPKAPEPELKNPSTESEELGDDFSWYRVKSKKKITAGMSKVVIWLSQPNSSR